MAKSRAAKDGNKYTREKLPPKAKDTKTRKEVLVRDHDSKVFQPKYLDYSVVEMAGKNQVASKRQSRTRNKSTQERCEAN